ncbi:hypothetical protein CCP2SC5_540011 [Azospirillaceae bacterium]
MEISLYINNPSPASFSTYQPQSGMDAGMPPSISSVGGSNGTMEPEAGATVSLSDGGPGAGASSMGSGDASIGVDVGSSLASLPSDAGSGPGAGASTLGAIVDVSV